MNSMTPLRKAKNTHWRFLVSLIFDNTSNFAGNINGIVFTSFVLFLGVSEVKIAFLFSLMGFGQVLQILSTIVYKHFPNKKKVIYISRYLRSILMILTACIPLFIPESNYFISLSILIIMRLGATNIIGGAYAEWNDHYVPEAIKGKYYGTRNVTFNLTAIILSFIYGRLLDVYSNNLLFYIVAFVCSLVFTLISLSLLRDIKYPKKPLPEDKSVIKQWLIPIKNSDYRSFILFSLMWSFSIGIGRSMLNVYAIKHLYYSYTVVALVGSFTAGLKLFSGLFFGNLIDKKGGQYVVRLCGIGFALSTFLYVFMAPNNPTLFFIANMINGGFMIGFNVAKFRQNIHLCKGDHMSTYISIHNCFMGLGTFVSVMISGWIIGLLSGTTITISSLTLNSYQLLLIISTLLHFLTVYYFVKKFMRRDSYGQKI